MLYGLFLQHVSAVCDNTSQVCQCTLPQITTASQTTDVRVELPIDAAWRHQCNRCVILGISESCVAETALDVESFRVGFWAPRNADITQSTVAVVKILTPATDVTNQHLTVRGFNTPTLQGCGRMTYPALEPAAAAWAANTARWAWQSDSAYDESSTVCAPDDQIWFYNLNVKASEKETVQSSPAVLHFEISIRDNIYLTRTTASLREQLVDQTVATSITRGLYPVTARGIRPLTLDLVPKLFSVICRNTVVSDTYGHSVQLPFEGAYMSMMTQIPPSNYCTISSLDKTLSIYISETCNAPGTTVTTVIILDPYSSYKLVAPESAVSTTPQQRCSFDVQEHCNVGFERPPDSSDSCTACTAGKFKNSMGVGACASCTAGKFMSFTGASVCDVCSNSLDQGRIFCESCGIHATGKIGTNPLKCECNSGFFFQTTQCVACAAGKYKEQIHNRVCDDCAIGTYSTTLNATRQELCVSCPSVLGHTSDPGSDSRLNCICKPGYQSVLNNDCQMCENRHYKATISNTDRCVLCKAGTFSASPGLSACLTCAVGSFSSAGETQCRFCANNSGIFEPSNECECVRGYTKLSTNLGLECKSCGAGTFKNTTGNAPCTECANGKFSDKEGNDLDVCIVCSANTYPNRASAAFSCTSCPDHCVSDRGSRDVTACKCKQGFTGEYGHCKKCIEGFIKTMPGKQTCNECESGTYADATSTICLSCDNNSYPLRDSDRTSCACVSGYEYDIVTLSCTQCDVASRKYKSTLGNFACLTCADERTYDAREQTCRDPALMEQVVRLFHGINYVAFHVFDENPNGTRITDIFKRKLNFENVQWKTATLNTESPFQGHVLNTNALPNRDFSSNNILHHRRNVYMINIEFYDSTHFVECSYHGLPLRKFTNMDLQLGRNNFIPVLYTSVDDNTKILPIQVASNCQDANSVLCFQYVQHDEFSWIFRNRENGGLVADTTSINALGAWTSSFSFTPGQFVQLTLRGDPKRPTGQNRMLLHVDNSALLDTSRSSSYGINSNVGTRRLLTVPTSTLDAYCPTETSETAQCACKSNSNQILSWPLRDCNQCVLTKTQSCSSMGQQLTLAGIKYTISVMAPSGVELTTNSVAVAKLKRSFQHSTSIPLPTKHGVEFEHLSIRAHAPAKCSCDGTNGASVDCGSVACVLTNKKWRFELSLAVMESEISRPTDANALVVNFEFDLAGVRYVTKSTELLRPEIQTVNSVPIEILQLFPSRTGTYALVAKRFQIVCPRDMNVVDTTEGTTCPFEGDTLAHINIDTLQRRTLQTFLDSPDLVAAGIKIRGSSSGPTPASTQHFKYTIQRERGQSTLYVTIKQAQFETCSIAGVYKMVGQFSCASPFMANNPNCASPFSTPPVQQTDSLHITMIRADRTSLPAVIWNKDSEISRPEQHITFKLAALDDTLEIDLTLDAFECTNTANRINISITTSAPAALDRLNGLNSSVQTCRTTQECACRIGGNNINWPLDECNACVISNLDGGVCDGMSESFVSSINSINYNIFVSNQIVDAESVAIGKLKNSKPFIVQGRSYHYDHLSVRSYVLPIGVGCFNTDDRTSLANAQWSTNSFQNCASRRKIFFFSLPIKASAAEIIELPGIALRVSFEVSIGDTLYVTKTQKDLRSFDGISSGVPYRTTIHDAAALTDSPRRYPLSVEMIPKQFEITCSSAQPIVCPFEGDSLTFLSLKSVNTGEVVTSYRILLRTIPDKKLYIKLNAFTFVQRDDPGTVQDFCSDPSHAMYDEAMATGVCEGTFKFSRLPVSSTDRLQVVYYESALARRENIYRPGIGLQAGNKWKLSTTGDLLEIILNTDGIYGNQDDFAFNFTISTSVIFEAPCLAGTSGPAGGPCVDCPMDTYSPVAGSNCTNCPLFAHTSSVRTTTLLSCQCQAGYGRTSLSSSAFTCSMCATGTFRGVSNCELCPVNSNSNEASNQLNDCICNDNYIRINSQSSFYCQVCSSNQYYTKVNGVGKCESCPQFSVSSSGSSSLSNCKCVAGYMQQSSTNTLFVCQACLNTQYYVVGTDTSGSCLSCPSFSTSSLGSLGGIASCACGSPYVKKILSIGTAGEFQCDMCANNEYRTNAQNQIAICLECPDFSTSPMGSSTIGQCTCDANFTKALGIGSLFTCVSTTQLNCQSGYYSATTGLCTPCEAGTYKPGQGSTTLCMTCGVNSQSNEGSAVCTCDPGHTRIDGACVACPANSYKTGVGDQMCDSCASHHVSPAASVESALCVCGPGAGGNACVVCASGTFKSTNGNGECEACAANMVSVVASTSRNNCMCAQGYGGQACTLCPANTYKEELGSSDCVGCILNSVSLPKSTREIDCTCVGSEGWQTTLISPRKCERTVILTTKKYEVPFDLDTFANNVNDVRTNFKLALALAHASNVANITLTYYATGTTAPVYTDRTRRRNMLQISIPNTRPLQTTSCTLDASIQSFASIPLPADGTTLAQLRITYPSLVQYTSLTPELSSGNGFSLFGLSIMWLAVIGGSTGLLFCIIVVFACSCRRRDPWESDSDIHRPSQNRSSETYRSMDRERHWDHDRPGNSQYHREYPHSAQYPHIQNSHHERHD